jgi:hypothetical protein
MPPSRVTSISRWTATSSAASIESPRSVYSLLRNSPVTPSPSRSNPVGWRVELERSIAIATSAARISIGPGSSRQRSGAATAGTGTGSIAGTLAHAARPDSAAANATPRPR